MKVGKKILACCPKSSANSWRETATKKGMETRKLVIYILTIILACGEQGHIKAYCPNREGKENKSSNKEKKGK